MAAALQQEAMRPLQSPTPASPVRQGLAVCPLSPVNNNVASPTRCVQVARLVHLCSPHPGASLPGRRLGAQVVHGSYRAAHPPGGTAAVHLVSQLFVVSQPLVRSHCCWLRTIAYECGADAFRAARMPAELCLCSASLSPMQRHLPGTVGDGAPRGEPGGEGKGERVQGPTPARRHGGCAVMPAATPALCGCHSCSWFAAGHSAATGHPLPPPLHFTAGPVLRIPHQRHQRLFPHHSVWGV